MGSVPITRSTLPLRQESCGTSDGGKRRKLPAITLQVSESPLYNIRRIGRPEADVYHCRTYDGRREIDLIVETADQRVIALEVKTSAEVTDSDVNQLLWLREQLGTTLADMLVITTGKHAYRRQDGIAVVPAALLGP